MLDIWILRRLIRVWLRNVRLLIHYFVLNFSNERLKRIGVLRG